MSEVLTKRCTKCGEVKPLDGFYARGGKCRQCMSAEAVIAKQKRRAIQAASVTYREGCQSPGECKSKGPGLCRSCKATINARSEAFIAGREALRGDQDIERRKVDAIRARFENPSIRAAYSERARTRMVNLSEREPEFAARNAERLRETGRSAEGRQRSAETATLRWQREAAMKRLAEEEAAWLAANPDLIDP